jgi:hypothetical protein
MVEITGGTNASIGGGMIENNTDNMRKSGSQYAAISDECFGLAKEISWTPAMAPLFVGADTTFAQKVAEFAKEVLARGDFLKATAEKLNTDANSCDRVDQDGKARYSQDGDKMCAVGDGLSKVGTGNGGDTGPGTELGQSQSLSLQTSQSQNGTTTNNSVNVATTPTADPQGTPPGSPPASTVVKEEITPAREEKSLFGTNTIPEKKVVTHSLQSSDPAAPKVQLVATTTTTPAHREPNGLFGAKDVPNKVETTYTTNA